MTVKIEEDPHFKKILDFLLKAKGFDGNQYKVNYIKRRIAVRMRATGTSTYIEYLKTLQHDPQEPSHLLDRLTIHVTEFFRDPGVYKAIQEKILHLIPEKPAQRLKIWCAGCSTGEEPYSVALMLAGWVSSHPELSYEIYGTDIDGPSVKTAERGEYHRDGLKNIPKAMISRWFHMDEHKAWVSSELKKHVRFRVHDLLGPWGPGLDEFDLVLCRNLLIYLTGPEQQKIYERFAKVLKPGGFLILGLTETLLGPSRKFFHCVDVKHRIYQSLMSIDQPEEDQKSG